MNTVINVLCMLFGGVLLLSAPLVLLQPESFEVAPVEIARVEAGGKLGSDQVRVTGGTLFWPEAVESYSEDMRTKETTSNGWFVPLISEAVLAEFEEARVTETEVQIERCRLMVLLSPELVEERFASCAAGEEDEIATAFDVVGTVKKGQALPLHVKKAFAADRPELDIDRLTYIEHGSDMAAWEVAVALAKRRPVEESQRQPCSTVTSNASLSATTLDNISPHAGHRNGRVVAGTSRREIGHV